jgi:hypothetical protein
MKLFQLIHVALIGAVLAARTSATPDVTIATFDGVDKATTFNWVVKNDPVMGGASTSAVQISNSSLVFTGK